MIVLDLPPAILAQVQTMAARAGLTPSAWLTDQIEHAYGTGRVTLPDQPRRLSRSDRRRIAASKRAARQAARDAASTPSNELSNAQP